MKRFLGAMLAAFLVVDPSGSDQSGDDKEAQAVLEKAMKALGGAEKLAAVNAITWKAKGRIIEGDKISSFTAITTIQGLDYFRSQIEGMVMGNKVIDITVLAGNKGWRKYDNRARELRDNELAYAKHAVYLLMVPTTLVHLKDKEVKVESAGMELVGARRAAVLKVTGPEGKELKLYFDQESGLPVKLVAKVPGFNLAKEVIHEAVFANYKEFNGIKKATKIEIKQDGKKFRDLEITEFATLEKVDPDAFAEPK